MAFLIELVLRVRLLVWLLVLIGGAALWWTNPPVRFEQSIEGFFPDDHPALLSHRRTTGVFGEDPFVFAAYDDLQLWTVEGMDRVRNLADAIQKQVPGVRRVDALDQMPVPWKVDAAVETIVTRPFALGGILGGLTTVHQEVKRLASNASELGEMRQLLCVHPLFNNLLIDPSGRMTALVVHLDQDQSKHAVAVEKLREVADRFAADQRLERVAVVGPPVLVVDGFASLEKDNRNLTVAAMLLMALTMLIALRNPWWALLPLIAGWTTWLVAQAVIGWLDLRLTLSSGPIVAQTVVLCIPAAAHLALRYRQTSRGGLPRLEAARQTLGFTFTPVFWCSVTAACGYLATWIAGSVLPVVQMGMTMFLCNLLAGTLTFFLAAAIMTGVRPRRSATPAPTGQVTVGVGRMTAWVIAHPTRTLLLFALPCLALAIGITGLRLESNYIKVYRHSARVAQDYRFVEDRMGGIGLVEVVFAAPEKVTVEWIERLKRITSDMVQQDRKVVRGVISVAELLASSVPSTHPKIAERALQMKVKMLQMPANVHFLDSVWNRKEGKMRLLVRVRESTEAEQKDESFAKLLAAARRELGDDAYLTGLSHLMTQITHAVIITASRSALWSCVIIVLMLAVALRSIPLALLAFTPTLLALGLVLGIMGWLDLKIDMATALVAAVAVGLSVDDSFHCLLHWKERKKTAPPDEALRAAYAGSGPGVILSSSAVSLGFIALMFSEFLPMANFGWLVAVATLGGSIGNLVFIPACIALLSKRSGVEPRAVGP